MWARNARPLRPIIIRHIFGQEPHRPRIAGPKGATGASFAGRGDHTLRGIIPNVNGIRSPTLGRPSVDPAKDINI